MTRRNIFNCGDCGKFVSHDDLADGKAKLELVGDGPDEATYANCANCAKDNAKYWAAKVT